MNDTTPRSVLVTGASGFLAAWIIPKLLARGRRVVAHDLRADTARLDLVTRGAALDGLRWAASDLGDAGETARIVAEAQPSDIIHLGALQIPACRADPVAGARVNVLGFLHVLEAAKTNGARVLYTSSMAAKPRGPANAPANLYGVYKRADEEIARLYAADCGVPSLGLRPHVVYGVGRDQGETSVATAAMRAAALGEPYALPWSSRTCFQLADDIAEMFVRALDADWEGAPVSDMSGVVESTDDVLDAIRAHVPHARVGTDGPERLSPIGDFDLAPLEAIIGELPRTPLADGVAATIEHFRALS